MNPAWLPDSWALYFLFRYNPEGVYRCRDVKYEAKYNIDDQIFADALF